jgi:predicted glycoside hydrolase/deacetylase ChbG (UPF0249 family)
MPGWHRRARCRASQIVGCGLLGSCDRTEIRNELERPARSLRSAAWRLPPDQVDGHQHVHVLPGIREVVLDTWRSAIRPAAPGARPSDRWEAIAGRRLAKARPRWWRRWRSVSRGGAAARAADQRRDFPVFPTSTSSVPYASELAQALQHLGPRPIVMCHPGHPDAEPAHGDGSTARRRMEYDA